MTQPDQNSALAATLTLMASAFAAATTLLAKALGTGALGPEMNALQISQGRFMFALLGILVVFAVVRPKVTRPDMPLHATRSLFGWGGVTLMFAAASFIPLSDATAISFLNPVFAMGFAVLFLGEKVGPWRWVAGAVGLLGAAILMRPGAGVLELGALLALGAATILGAELILIKKLSGREPPLQILLVNNTIGLVISSIVASFIWIWPTGAQWSALAGIGLLMAMAQFCFVNASRLADASFVSPFFFATLVFAAIYDFVIFGVRPDSVSLLGIVVILTGAALLAWRESRAKSASKARASS